MFRFRKYHRQSSVTLESALDSFSLVAPCSLNKPQKLGTNCTVVFRSSPASLSHARPRRTSHLSTTLSGPGSNVESFEMAFLSQGSDPVSKSRTIGEQNPLKNHPKRSSRKQVHLQVRTRGQFENRTPQISSEAIWRKLRFIYRFKIENN